jgi:hypothetical membrane protein
MQITPKVKTFNDKYPLVGPTMWIMTVEYFIIQIIVAAKWKVSYSLSSNTISDLGNTSCGLFNHRYVCSPLHNLMNGALIGLGVFMMIGSILIYQEFKETKLASVGFSFLFLGGIGTVLVGIFPENTISALHIIGASLPFLIGNVGLVVLGISLTLPSSLRIFTLVVGLISLIAFFCYINNFYLGLGDGGMERVVAYPQTIWLIIFGLYISKNHYSRSKILNH